ncbi:MAG TPA: histidine--tRNA ligase [Oscillospiraceae bacterium]|nr:histidine--tRNA ligase [Oscillospiraceae bacterium]
MERVKPRILSGFMELLPARQMQFDRMVQSLRESYSLYGFTPLDTPLIEASEVLLAKGGGETEKQIYRFTKGESDLSLRFDLTVPLARYVAQHYGELAFPFRRFQIGKVYRGERAQRGRFREFYQADIDVIGDGSLDILSEAEIPAVIYRTFTALGLRRFRIRVNNRKILNGLFRMLGLSGRAADVMRTVDKLDKLGDAKVKALLEEECAVPAETAGALLALLHSAEPLAALASYEGKNGLLDEGISELRTVVGHLAGFGVPGDHFAVDLTIARGLDYYTGTVYETTLLDHPEIGSICSGGRYDDLAGYYTDKKLPGVGISIGLTRLFYVLEEQKYLSDDLPTAPADALVLPMTDDLSPAVALATALREAGVRTQLYGEKKKFKAKMSYADKLGVPYVLLLGEDEIAAGRVSLKEMRSGAQTLVTKDEAARIIREGLAALDSGTVIRDKNPDTSGGSQII